MASPYCSPFDCAQDDVPKPMEWYGDGRSVSDVRFEIATARNAPRNDEIEYAVDDEILGLRPRMTIEGTRNDNCRLLSALGESQEPKPGPIDEAWALEICHHPPFFPLPPEEGQGEGRQGTSFTKKAARRFHLTV